MHSPDRNYVAKVTYLKRFLQLCALREAFPHAIEIYLVVDNWPVHFHPALLALLAPQQWPWSFNTPPNWPAFREKDRIADPLPIQLLPLPTYASWLNPIASCGAG